MLFSLLGARNPAFSALISSFFSPAVLCLYGLKEDLVSSSLIFRARDALSPSDSAVSFDGSVLPMLLHVAAKRAKGDFFCSSSYGEKYKQQRGLEVKIKVNFTKRPGLA